MINNKQKAILHIARAQLGLTEEEYRDILTNHGGMGSANASRSPGLVKRR